MKKYYRWLLILHGALSSLAFADDCAVGLSLINSGKFDEGREYITKAYKANPSSAQAQYAYARICPVGVAAGSIYRRIAENESAKDSIRAKACFQLGRFYYAAQRYDSAQILFAKAEKLSPKKEFSRMKALAANNRGDARTAEPVWIEMISGGSGVNQAAGRYYLGNLFFRQGNYEEALNCYAKASEEKGDEWRVASLSGACASAYNGGNARRGDELYEQLLTEYPSFLESAMIQGIVKGHSVAETDIVSQNDTSGGESFSLDKEDLPAPKKPEKGAYTLQVGAFTSKDNAKKLYNEIKRDFNNAVIKEETVNNKIFYRVRVGSFSNEQEALEFGEKELKEKGFNFRVIKE